jgi:peptidoglycan/xylan/chitin deacetylase (PgdA/CDA1 family)
MSDNFSLAELKDHFFVKGERYNLIVDGKTDIWHLSRFLILNYYFDKDSREALVVSEDNNIRTQLVREIRNNKINSDRLSSDRNYIISQSVEIPSKDEFRRLFPQIESRSGIQEMPVQTNLSKTLYIAITIDDGPHLGVPSITNSFYSYLSDNNIKATWFIQYYKLKIRIHDVDWIPFYKRIQNEGHEIGVHNYYYSTHPTHSPTGDLIKQNDHISWVTAGSSDVPKRFDTFDESFQAARACLNDLKKMGLNVTYGRPPGGRLSERGYLQSKSSKEEFDRLLDRFFTELGFMVWPGNLEEKWDQDWNVELDHEYPLERNFKPNFKPVINRKKYIIILTHDNNAGSLPELQKGIEWINNTYGRDYAIKYLTLTQLAASYDAIINQELYLP